MLSCARVNTAGSYVNPLLPGSGPLSDWCVGYGAAFFCVRRNHSLKRAPVTNLCDEPLKERRQVEEVGLATPHLSFEQILAFQ